MIEYNGKTITVDNTGMFVCGDLTASSLAAMKKKLYGDPKVFVPFKALSSVNAGYERNLTGIRKSPSKWQTHHVFAWGGSKYDTAERVWLPITDEADTEAIADLNKRRDSIQEQVNALNQEIGELGKQATAIKNKYSITADEYLAGKRP